jgi:hypothetical protein
MNRCSTETDAEAKGLVGTGAGRMRMAADGLRPEQF